MSCRPESRHFRCAEQFGVFTFLPLHLRKFRVSNKIFLHNTYKFSLCWHQELDSCSKKWKMVFFLLFWSKKNCNSSYVTAPDCALPLRRTTNEEQTFGPQFRKLAHYIHFRWLQYTVLQVNTLFWWIELY